MKLLHSLDVFSRGSRRLVIRVVKFVPVEVPRMLALASTVSGVCLLGCRVGIASTSLHNLPHKLGLNLPSTHWLHHR